MHYPDISAAFKNGQFNQLTFGDGVGCSLDCAFYLASTPLVQINAIGALMERKRTHLIATGL